MDRLDPYLSRIAMRAWTWAQVVEHDDGSWTLYLTPGHIGRALAQGGPVDPRSPRRRFHEARRELRRLIAEATSATGLAAKAGRGPAAESTCVPPGTV